MEDATLPKKQINLLRGWPNPSLLPTSQIQAAANVVLSNSSISTPGLLYGPDPGYQPLRQSIAQWLHSFYRNPTLSKGDDRVNTDTSVPDAERICITGGASQNLACVLQVFTDPLFTKVWMVAPCYYLACRIFEDAGLRTRAVGEGQEGVDLDGLERALKQSEKDAVGEVSAILSCKWQGKGKRSCHVTQAAFSAFLYFMGVPWLLIRISKSFASLSIKYVERFGSLRGRA
jgi:DNA-binding transcriptional MocR family regulator